MKSNIIKEFNLPKYIKGKSFAEASKAISKKFDERTDPQAQKTKEELLERLAEAQEYVKMQEKAAQQSMQQSMDNNATEVEDQMNGQIPEGMEEFMPQQNQQMAMGGTIDSSSEYKKGGLLKRKDGSYSKRGLWDNIRDNKGSGKKPTPQMLKQEKKINKYVDGGLLNKIQEIAGGKGEAMQTVDGVEQALAKSSSIPKSGGMGKVGAYADGAGQLLDIGNNIFGNTGIDTSGNGQYQKEINEGGATASGALKGAASGAQIGGPWGAAIGGVVGGVGSLFGAKSKNKDILEANQNKTLADNSKLAPNTFSKGGYTNKYEKGGKYNTNYTGPGLNMGLINRELAKQTVGNNLQSQGIETIGNKTENIVTSNPLLGEPTSTNNAKTTDINNDSNLVDKIKEFGSKYGTDLGRISPTVFNLIRAGNLEEAEQVRRKTLDNKYDPNYVDVNQMINKIDQNNVNKALSESSGGDLGALRSNILAANLNKDKAKSDAYINAEQINRGEDRAKQQFDSNIDKLNLNQANADLIDNMQNRGARETAKNNLLSSSITDIGRMSKEMQDRKIAAEATGYTWDGEFITDGDNKITPKDLGLTEKDGNLVDENGNKVTKEELQKRIKKNKKE